jgi:hypothetical protein
MRRGWVSVLAAAGIVIWVGARPAAAQSGAAGGLMPLDARHFVLLKGDRLVVYEVDPAHGYALQVVNTALLNEEGQVLGQFRPEKPAAVPIPPEPKKTAPRVPPAPASEPPVPAPLSAQRVPAAPVARKGRIVPRLVTGSHGEGERIARRQATSPLAARPVQPIMQMAVGPAVPVDRRSANKEALRTGYLDVASLQGTVPGP